MSNIQGSQRPLPAGFAQNSSYGVCLKTNGSTRTLMYVPLASNSVLGTDSSGNPVAWTTTTFKGDKGDTGLQGLIGLTGSAGATGSTGAMGSTGPKGDTGSQGIAGSSASATPLGSASPQPLGIAVSGSSSNASREDHVHLAQVTSLSTATIAESALTTLSLGVRRVTVSVTGATIGSNYLAFPTSALSTGYGIVDAICTTAGQITFGILVPVLTLGSYSISVRVLKLL